MTQMQGKSERKEMRKWGWTYLEVREKIEEVRSKIRVGEINCIENREMGKGKAKKIKGLCLAKVREN